jgi:site-specific recombinase XerC
MLYHRWILVQQISYTVHMAITVTPVLRRSKERDNGRAPVWIRITANRKSRFVSTGVQIAPEYWNDTKKAVRKTHELASAYNAKIRRVRLQAEEAALESSSAEAVKTQITSSGGSFTAYFESFIGRLRDRDQYWERKKYNTTLNKLQATLGNQISWNDLTPAALRKLERHCREERGNNPNTTRKELSRVRRVINQAVKEQLLDAGSDPFQVYELPKGVATDRRRLSMENMQALQELDPPPGSDLLRDRDAFLLAFYGGGVRFGDVCRLRPGMVAEGRLRYRMMKTDKPVSVQLPDPAHDIVARWSNDDKTPYLFPYLDAGDERDPVHLRKRISVWNQMVNRSLKKLAAQAGIENPDDVTFHVARHSFADLARKSSGDLYAVSKALGHSNLKITERYLSSFDQDAVDSLTDSMWNDE